jgi:hypothetical protein
MSNMIGPIVDIRERLYYKISSVTADCTYRVEF